MPRFPKKTVPATILVEDDTMPVMEDSIEDPTESVESTPKAPKTDWNVLTTSKLHPSKIECREYQPVNFSVVSCHSKLVLSAEAMKSHLDADHGGSFFVTLVQRDTPWRGWKDLSKLGLELADFRCDVCLKEIPLTSASISKHMKPHLNGNRRMIKGGTFRITLANNLDDTTSFDE